MMTMMKKMMMMTMKMAPPGKVCGDEDGEDEDGVDDEDHYHDAKLTFTPSKARQYCLWG